MLKDFRAYQMAIRFHKNCKKLFGPPYLKYQLLRASSSAVLTLAEGSERATIPDRRRFFRMAMGSIRECQAILEIMDDSKVLDEAKKLADSLGAITFKLCQSLIDKSESQSGSEAGDQ